MLYKVENENLIVSVSSKGAELQSLTSKDTQLEYLWNADAKFWTKHSPVLFPIVGSLKNNSYCYNEKKYSLSRHGFARDMEFSVTEETKESITFSLSSSEETLEKYPFHFKFSIQYSLTANKLFTRFTIENTGEDVMYFSVGAHPAFKVPLVKNTIFEDYYLEFNEMEGAGRYGLSTDGLAETNATDFLNNTNILPLKKSLFYSDAIIFKDLKSDKISIRSAKTNHGLTIHFPGFPYFGIWNAKDADFLCLEPWCGITDAENTTGFLPDKEGINKLNSAATFVKAWNVELY